VEKRCAIARRTKGTAEVYYCQRCAVPETPDRVRICSRRAEGELEARHEITLRYNAVRRTPGRAMHVQAGLQQPER